MSKLKSIYTRRRGNGYTDLTKRHTTRTYKVNGVTFWLEKHTGVDPQYYELFAYENHNIPHILVDNAESWGHGISWTAAENKAYSAILNYLNKKEQTK